MTFLNAALAFGALAFTVPLAIHLLFRSRFRTIEWGAMHLLDGVVRINRRRIQLLHLLLLLLRCLLPVLLAFCLARPVLTGFRSLPGDAPQTVVLAIDDSRSMSARDSSGVSRLDRVKQDLRGMIQNLSRRDEVILVRSSRTAAPVSTMGSQEALRQLRELRAESGPFDLGRFLRAAVEAADQASHPRRRIVVVSDFQSHSTADAALQSLRRLSTSLAEKPVRPVISFLNLGVNSDQLSNVSVESVDLQSPAVVAGRGARFTARLRNNSDTPARDLRVVWSVDGNALRPRMITIPPRATVSTRLSHRLDQVGVHEIAVAVQHGDALMADNRRSIAVDVIREIKVMLVDGKPSTRPLEGETDFLAIALSPFAFGGEDLPDAVRTTVTAENRLSRQIQQEQPDMVVLANVAQPSKETKRTVAQFVIDGGALIVFDGGAIRPDAYNSPWSGPGGSWLLPAAMGDLVGSQTSRDASPLPIGDHNTQYAPWELLGGRDQQPFADVEVYGYRKLTVRQPSPADASVARSGEATGEETQRDPADPTFTPGAAVEPLDAAPVSLLAMAGGDPLVVSARRGGGRVVQFAVPCDTAWTTLPMRMVYLPMMQQLVLDLAGSRKQTTIEVGRGFAVPIRETASLVPDDAPRDERRAATFTLQAPGRAEAKIEPTDPPSSQLIVTDTSQRGTYRIRQTTPLKDAEPIVTSTIRVVEVPALESELRDTQPSRLAAAAGLVEANVYTDLATLESDDRTRRYGREIWRWLLIGLLVLMVAELFLQQQSVRAPVVGAAS